MGELNVYESTELMRGSSADSQAKRLLSGGLDVYTDPKVVTTQANHP
jgi:hypothetical protein